MSTRIAWLLLILVMTPIVTAEAQSTTRAEAEASIIAAEAAVSAAEAADIDTTSGNADLERARASFEQRGYTRALAIAEAVREDLTRALSEANRADAEAAQRAKIQAALEEALQATETRLSGIGGRVDGAEQLLNTMEEAVRALKEAVEGNSQMISDQDSGVRAELAALLERTDRLILRVDGLAEQLEQVEGQLLQHEGRLEENGLRLFETLMGIDASEEELAAMRARLDDIGRVRPSLPQRGVETSGGAVVPRADDGPGFLLALVMGLAFPVGVMLFVGVHPASDSRVTNLSWGLVPWLAGGAGYAIIGYSLMFGASQVGLFGLPATVPELFQMSASGTLSEPLRQLAMQLPLAGAAGLLLCSAVAGRLTATGCLIASASMGALLYPLVGHWTLIASGMGSAPDQPIGWLAAIGVSDPGDAIGLAALAGAASLALAAGLGRKDRSGTAAGPESGCGLIAIGTLVLWAAWLVSVLATGQDMGAVPWLAMATAAAAAGAAAPVILVGLLGFDDRGWERCLPGGLLAGVLAASAAYALAGVLPMLLLGLVTGSLFALFSFAFRTRLDPEAELALVFTVGGISGALAPGLLGPEGLLMAGVLSGLLTQAFGLLVALALAVTAGTLLAVALRLLPGGWAIRR
jgi:ammonia channel protein AmtB